LHSGQPTDVLGKAVVVHEKADDYQTQPSGNSGSRIACGVITVQPPPETTGTG
jgi:Cu-Zn family superoxide dismutase